MTNWLDKYEQGGMVLKKKTKDNYGKRENANEGYSTAGPGWIGEGTTNKGFNYNGAWGGTMAMGGALPGAVGFTYARTQDPAPSNGPYAKKTLASAQSGKNIPTTAGKVYHAEVNDEPIFNDPLTKLHTLPTTADSTRLYNSQIALNKFYENEMKAGRLKMSDIATIFDFNNYSGLNKDLNKANLNFYRGLIGMRKDMKGKSTWDDIYKELFNMSPEQIRQLENKGLGQTKSSSEYQEYYRDLVTPLQNLASPFALIDKRIAPQRKIHYEPGEKHLNYPGGSVSVYDYDPILIKPVNMLTPEEKALRIKKYGKASGIKETVSKPIQKIVSKPKPKPKPKPEPEPTPVVEQQPVTTPIQQPTPQPKQLYNYDDGEQLMAPIPNGWGFGTMGGGAVVGVKKKDGTIEYIKPEDYKRMGVPKYGQDYIKAKQKMQKGGVIKDDRGQWAYPGEITEIGSNDITMQGVDYPVLGVSDTGDTQMMYPDQDYKFDGEKVTEYPMMQEGGWLDKYQDGGNINKKLKEEAEEFLARQIANRTTMSQYTPKPGEQAKFDKQKLERIAEENAPLNRMAASKGAENIQDAALFALDVMLLGQGTLALKGLAKPALKAAGKYLTEKTALKNAYKLNPYAFKPTEGMMYRGIGKEGMEDALQSGLFRAKQDVTPTSIGNFNTTRQFSKAYYSPRFDIADQYGQGFIAEVPKEASGWGKRYGTKEWSQIAQRDIPTTEGKVLQKDWLKRYKEVPQPTSTQRVTRGPVNYWEEPGFAKRNPNFNPEAYENSPIGNASASRDIPEGMTPYIKVDDVTPNVKPSWKSQELPGLHISATMEGGPISKIIEPKTGLINVDQALTIIGKESGGASKVDMIKQALGKDIPKKMDYNDFRKTVQDQLIPLEREVVNTFRSAYNIDKLGYTKASTDGKDIILNRINNTRAEILKFETKGTPEGWEDYFKRMKENLETDLKEYSNLPLENQTIRLSNRSKFGKGADTHGNPEETLGHIHFLRDAESPDILTMTQLQSDAFQSTNRTMPKSLEEANAKLNKLKDDVNYTYKTFGNSPADLQTFKDVINKAKESLSLEEASVKNFSQKSLLDKNHQERYLQELVDYAGKRGDINKIRVPTSETAAKVQGYKETSLTGDNAPGFGKLQEEISIAVRQGDQQKVNDLMKVHDEMLKTPYKTYSSDQKTILKKYSEQPKVIKKVFGVEPKTVKDSKGNSWYEFDIPAKFKGGKGEIKAFEDGGWLNKYK